MAGPGDQHNEIMTTLQKYSGLVNEDRKRLIRARLMKMPHSLEKERALLAFDGTDHAVDAAVKVAEDSGVEAGINSQSTWRAIKGFGKKAGGQVKAIGQDMIGGAQTVASAIDYPDRKVTRPLKAALVGIDPSFAENSSDFHGAIDHKAQQGDARAMGYQTIAPAIGGAILAGAKRGPAGRIAGAVIGSAGPKVLDALGFEGAADFTRDFADEAGLSLLQIPGLSSMKAGTGGATSRLLRSARTPADAARAEAAVARLAAKEFKPGTFAKVESELLAAGVPKAEISRTFGETGERFMRGQGELGGKQIVQDLIDRAARKAGKGGGHGEFLGEKAADKIFKPVQATRVAVEKQFKMGGALPGVSRRAPASVKGVETLGQERQRLRFMDIAEREARGAAKTVTDRKLARTRNAIPQTQTQIDAVVDDAFDAGANAGHTSLATKLAEITGTTVDALPPVAKRYLDDFSVKTAGAKSKSEMRELVMAENERFRRVWNVKNLPGKQAYTIRNVSEDMGKMFVAGATPKIGIGGDIWPALNALPRAPDKIQGLKDLITAAKSIPSRSIRDIGPALKHAEEAEKVLAAGGQLSAAQTAAIARIRTAEKAGVDLGSSLRQDLSMREGRHVTKQDLARKAGIAIPERGGVMDQLEAGVNYLRTPFDKAPAALMVNRKAMDWWEKFARLSMFEDGISKGMSPQLANEYQANVLLDYGKTLGKTDRGLKNLFSFLAYKVQAPVAAARLMATNPGGVNTLKAAAESAQPYREVEETQAPRWQQERGMTRRAPAPLNEFRRAVLGKNNVPAQSNLSYPVGPINEMQQPVDLAQAAGSMNLKHIAGKLFENASPLIQIAGEAFSGERATTGAKIAEPWKDALSKVLAPISPSYLTDHMIEGAANWIDKDMPDRFIGQYDNVALEQHPFLKTLLDIPGKTTDPNAAQEFQNATSGPEFEGLKRLTDVSVRKDLNDNALKKKYGR